MEINGRVNYPILQESGEINMEDEPLILIKVGASYGQKMMTGFLSSQGFHCSEKRIGASLRRINPTRYFCKCGW